MHSFESLTVEQIFDQLIKKKVNVLYLVCGRSQDTQLAASLKLIGGTKKLKKIY